MIGSQTEEFLRAKTNPNEIIGFIYSKILIINAVKFIECIIFIQKCVFRKRKKVSFDE